MDTQSLRKVAHVSLALLAWLICVIAPVAAHAQGNALAWGMNDLGQLGNGTKTESDVPVQVTGLSGVVAMAAGFRHSLAVKSDGTLWAWGENNFGQLGTGTTTDS